MKVSASSTDSTATMKRHSLLAEGEFTLPAYKKPNESQFIDLFSTALATYLREFFKDNRFLDNQGLMLDDNEHSKQGKLVNLDSLFVFPAASEQHITPEVFNTFNEQDVDENTLSLAQLMHNAPRLTLLGDPGSGKTTFIQWLSSSLAYDSQNAAHRYLGNLLPLVLTARRLKTDALPNIRSNIESDETSDLFLSALIESMNPSIGQPLQQCLPLVKELLEKGQVILMVDGIDEISDQQSESLAKQLRQLLANYSSTRLILTARVVGFSHREFWFPELAKEQQNPVVDDGINLSKNPITQQEVTPKQLYPLYYLAPFDNARRTNFAQSWAKQYHPKQGEIPSFIQLLKNACFDSSSLNALSRNPVLLTMICFIQWRRGQLPNGRAELYQRIVSTYLVQLDQARRKDAGYSHQDLPFDYEDMEYWIAKLAWHMQCGDLKEESLTQTKCSAPFEELENRITSITASNLQLFFAAHIASITGDEDSANNDAEQLIEFIKKRTGFLIPKGLEGNEEIFAFSHLSFQEYFAGYFITQYWQEWSANEDELSKLQATLIWDTWQEVWQLAFEETKRRRQSAMLEALFDEDTGFLADSDANLLLAKLLMNTTLRFEPVQKQRKLLQCWNVTNQLYMDGALTLFWSNKDTLDIVLQPHQCTHLSLGHLSHSQLQEFLPKLPIFTQLTTLSIRNQQLEDISVLAKITNLTRLVLANNQISNFTLLKELTSLVTLNLRNTNITDVSVLTKLARLNWLSLHNTQISDISTFPKLTNLSSLDLSNTQISDISVLANLTSLTSLYLNNTHINDISILPKLVNLTTLSLNDTKISDISALANLTSLTSLYLHNTQIIDISILAKLVNLSALSFSGAKISNISVLSKLRNLTHLGLNNTQPTDLSILLQLNTLQFLWLDKSTAKNHPEIIQQLEAKSVVINIV